MTSTDSTVKPHPVLGCAAEVSAALIRVIDTPAIFMSDAEKRTALVALDTGQSRLAELRLRVLAAADVARIGDAFGATSTAAYVATQTRQTRESVAADVRFAAGLDRDFDGTRRALAAGAVNVAQAKVIVSCLSRLSDEVAPADRERAERHLIDKASDFDPQDLLRLGMRLFEVIDPDKADEEEGRALDRQERAARRSARFAIRSNGDGTHSGFFKLPELQASILRKALQAIVAPRRIGDGRFDDKGRKIPYPNLLGQGFMELLEHLPADALPRAGGACASIVVTVDQATLLTGLGAATLDDGTRISVGEARRLACEAGIIPLVLGGDSQPLDVGRAQRLHTTAQRTALAHRDGGCTAEDCDRPPARCEAHHETPWSDGGGTSVDEGRLLCFHHHVRAHDDAYLKTRLPTGQLRYRRRQ